MSIESKSIPPAPAKAAKRRKNREFTLAQGKRELAVLDREIAKFEKLVSDISEHLELLHFDRSLVRGAMQIVSRL